MYKRIVIFFSLMMLCIGVAILNTYKISNGDMLCEAASRQSSYRLKVAQMRGNIYDCKKNPLVGVENETFFAVNPQIIEPNVLLNFLSENGTGLNLDLIKNDKPFVLKVKGSNQLITNGINTFSVPKRYAQDQLAPHIIGYLNSDLNGVSGIEKSFNDYLNKSMGNIFIKYKVDALNRRIPGENVIVENTMYKHSGGVVLTLDEKIQRIAQSAAKKYIKKGAIVITEVPTCEIRACVSTPEFCPTDIASVLNDSDAPLINRALLPYNLGSVFKIVTAAAILNSNNDSETLYNCKGMCKVDGHEFHCFDGKGHGDIDLEKAIAFSCNTYFIEKSFSINGKILLDLSRNLGFEKEIELAPGIISKSGVLPTEESLKDKRALANFSFGQGKLLATPIQVAALMNTIASGGMYCEPQLVMGLVNENLEYVQKSTKLASKRILSEDCTNNLIKYMKASVEYGTSAKGKPEIGTAAAKTGTAQTGIKIDDRYVIQAWYAGIYPADKPKYSIVVFAEDAKGGGESCGPAFKKIAQDIFYEILKSRD